MPTIRTLLPRVPGWLYVAGVVAVTGVVAFGQEGAGSSEAHEMSFLELLLKGRWFMVPIGLASLVGLAIIIERLIALRRSQVIPQDFVAGLNRSHGEPGDREAALEFCRQNASPMARIAQAGLNKLHRGPEAIESAIEDAGANEVSKLRQNLRTLYGIAAISPMLGLLGTVWGMIDAFRVASVRGLGQAEYLATGIYQALVTTFAGLLVAIPAVMFYYYFLGRIDSMVHDMNEQSYRFVEHWVDRRLADPVGAGAE